MEKGNWDKVLFMGFYLQIVPKITKSAPVLATSGPQIQVTT